MNLENRIPPPVVLLICLVLMKVADSLLGTSANDGLYGLRLIFVLVFVITGFVIAGAGVMQFKKAQTTVNPLKPSSASTLVRTGISIFSFTRNPMYLGMLSVTIAWCVFLANPWNILFVIGFYLFINRYQITPEERAMAQLFGDEFNQYEKQVRRWL